MKPAPPPRKALLLVARLVTVAVVTVLAAPPASAAGESAPKKAYRWTDSNNVIHYGDTVPPEYAQQQSAIVNRQGVEVGRVDARATPEQLAEEQRRLQEVARGKQHDSFLLTTYTSVKDIEELRDERLSQLEGQIGASQTYIESLETRLRALQTRALTFKPYSDKPSARRMPDQLADELLRTLGESRSQVGALESKRKEQALLREQFQTDIDRYRQLVSAHQNAAR